MKIDSYMTWLLDQIDLKKNNSFGSAFKTDLYSEGDMLTFCNWIDDIKNKIKEYPPCGYASQVILIQDDKGSLLSVRYTYSSPEDVPQFVEIIIDYDAIE